jgi:hypothetical protein
MISRKLLDGARRELNVSPREGVKRSAKLRLPLDLVGNMLPGTAATSPEDRTGCRDSVRGGAFELDELGRREPLLF